MNRIHGTNIRRAFGSKDTLKAYSMTFPRHIRPEAVDRLWDRNPAIGIEVTAKLAGLSDGALDIATRVRGQPLCRLGGAK